MTIPTNGDGEFEVVDNETGATVGTGVVDDGGWVTFEYTDGDTTETTVLLVSQFESAAAALPQFKHMTVRAAA